MAADRTNTDMLILEFFERNEAKQTPDDVKWVIFFHVVSVYLCKQELIRRWDSERELVNDDIAHM